MKHRLLLLYSWFIRIVLFFMPDVPIIMRFRGWLYGLGMKKCGRDFQVTHDARITGLECMTVGKHCFVGNQTLIFANNDISFEDEVMIGPLNLINDGNHTSLNGSFRFGFPDRGTILLKKGCWVSASCIVLRNSVLPEGAVLAANSVLNEVFDLPNSIYVGSPAIFKKQLSK